MHVVSFTEVINFGFPNPSNKIIVGVREDVLVDGR